MDLPLHQLVHSYPQFSSCLLVHSVASRRTRNPAGGGSAVRNSSIARRIGCLGHRAQGSALLVLLFSRAHCLCQVCADEQKDIPLLCRTGIPLFSPLESHGGNASCRFAADRFPPPAENRQKLVG